MDILTGFSVRNFKSVVGVDIDVGRVNFLMGGSGVGKSNVLEALLFGVAGFGNCLKGEILVPRGMRFVDSMRSAFSDVSGIDVGFRFGSVVCEVRMDSSRGAYPVWFSEVMGDRSGLEGMGMFMKYAPEYGVLRNLERGTGAYPLGVRGEGLAWELARLYRDEPYGFRDVCEVLDELFEWYGGMGELDGYSLHIRDAVSGGMFTQRGVGEGFLRVLFVLVALVSGCTPRVFGVENVDSGLDFRLCVKFSRAIVSLAKRYGKQVFCTFSNPAVLDGLDLSDGEQRVLNVFRGRSGETECVALPVGTVVVSSVRERMLRLFKDDAVICARIRDTFNGSSEELTLSQGLMRGYFG